MKKRAELKVKGIVQGVGFRPFCYRTAVKLGLKGSVKNTGDAGVKIILEGEEDSIKIFLKELKNKNPPIAKVEDVKVKWSNETEDLRNFKILESDRKEMGESSVIPPDICLCEECHQEMMDPNDRRYHYPFITCVNCGPRFTVIEDLPYDRERTSMYKFPLCKDCEKEYKDPADRRYHAEPICCPEKGPKMILYDAEGNEIKTSTPIKKASKLLDKGKIVAVKGIGGIHIASKTTDDSIIKKLRKRFGRPEQPLAVMAKNLETTKKFAKISHNEKKLLTSYKRPITILRKKDNFQLSNLISPDLDSIGVMLPYTGIHFLLFAHGNEPAYVMTSANLPGLPMIIDNSEAKSELKDQVDYFLLHNRKIINRCDDSVVRMSGGKPAFIRRSRGYVPTPIETEEENERSIIALGADMDNTISISNDNRIFPSQYLGDMENIENIEYLEETANRFLKWLNIESPEFIACDLHPDFSTTNLAQEMAEETGAELIKIQHHKAHLYSLMAEKDLDELVGIAADGLGYGEDGTIWGGEVLTKTQKSFRKTGGIKQYYLPGGDLATKFPARALAGILWKEEEPELVEEILVRYCGDWLGEKDIQAIIQQLKTGFNTPKTSSTGRALDAISCLLGVCRKRTYEGEPAIKLEAFANRGDPDKVDLEPLIDRSSRINTVDIREMMIEITGEIEKGTRKVDLALSAEKSIARGLAKIAVEEAQEQGIKNIGVSGGVFYNSTITKTVQEVVNEGGLNFWRKEKIPPGDGGISVGQVFSIMKDY